MSLRRGSAGCRGNCRSASAFPRRRRQHVGEAPLRLPGEQGDSEVERLFQLAGVSGSMARQPETWKPPMQTGTPAARRGRATSMTRGNWFDCTPTKPTSPRPPASAIWWRCGRAGRGYWSRRWEDLDVHVGAEHPAMRGVLRDAVKAGERVGRQGRAKPLMIALIVVMGGLDQNDIEDAGGLGDRLGRHSHPLAKARQLLFSLKILARL